MIHYAVSPWDITPQVPEDPLAADVPIDGLD